MREIGFAVIGCGLMGREFASAAARWMHLSGMKARPKIVAVCDTNPALMSWFTEALGPVFCTTDYRDLLTRPEVEAIYCAVPHVLHAELYPAILRAGKHLFGEKPFGMDRAQNRTILAAIAENPGSFVRCSSEMPFYPGAQKVIDFVRSGAVGPILEVEGCFLHSSDINPDKPLNWKRMAAVNGDYGCLGDLGMHVAHVPLRLGWRPSRLSASLVKRVRQRPDGKGGMAACDTWDNATIHAHVPHADGDFPMTLKTWRIAPGEANSWSIKVLGMTGSAVCSTRQPRHSPLFPAITGGLFEFGFTDAILQMWAAYVDELAGGDARGFGCATPQEAADHHAILTAALQAGVSGTTVAVDY